MDLDQTLYPGGYYHIMRFLDRKETPFTDPLSLLPPEDVDLTQLAGRMLPDAPDPTPGDWTDPATKDAEMRHLLAGQSELALLHALTIAILRRRDPPDRARALFLRMWREQGAFLARELPVRWLVSAATTFADHGDTMDQRLGGLGLSMLFDLVTLHDSERRLSGRPNDSGFPRVKGKKRGSMAFDMYAYPLPVGDTDRYMLARLWRYTENDAVLHPLGKRLMHMVMTDPRSIFGRIQRYKKRRPPDGS